LRRSRPRLGDRFLSIVASGRKTPCVLFRGKQVVSDDPEAFGADFVNWIIRLLGGQGQNQPQ